MDKLDPHTESAVRFLARCCARRRRSPEQAVAQAVRVFGASPAVQCAVEDEMNDYWTGLACDIMPRGGSRH